MQAQSIDEVIAMLTEIIDDAITHNDPIGYFPALYRNVTISVKKAIKNGVFEDGPRMEQLDVRFANRYLAAYTAYKNGDQPTESWSLAFDATQHYWPIVLQHLLLGMNAHINLDLGIAAARISPGDKIHSLKHDFDQINVILADLVGSVEEDLSAIWPTLKKILKWTSKIDTFLINFSMDAARDAAWSFACTLAPLSLQEQAVEIKTRDSEVAKAGHLISSPGWIISAIFKIIRLGERGSVADKIKQLAQPPASDKAAPVA